jgi:drug/metabolite transporter (DMT)-like permease
MLAVGVLFWGERVGRAYGLALAATFVGLVLATGAGGYWIGGSAQAPLTAQYAWGVAACLLGSVLMAAVTLLAHRLRAVPAGTLAWWQCALGAGVLWLWPLSQGIAVPVQSWGWLLALGVLHTGLAYGLIFAGMARLPPGRIAVYQFLYPLVALVMDAWVLGTSLGVLQLSGVVLMAVAMLWAERVGPAAGRNPVPAH